MQNVSDLPIAYIQATTMFNDDQVNKGTAYVIIWLAMYIIFQFNLGLFQLVEKDFNDMKDHESLYEFEKKKVSSTQSTDNGLTTERSNTPQKSENGDNYNHNLESSEVPISPTSTVDADADDDDGQSLSSDVSAESHASNPHPLVSTLTNATHLTHKSLHSQHLAIARIPSARSPVDYTTAANSNGSSRRMSLESQTSSIRIRRNLSHVSKALSCTSGASASASANGYTPTLNAQLIREYSRVEPYNQNTSTDVHIITETNLSSKDIKDSGKDISFVNKYHLNFLVFFLKNFKKPNSISLVLSLIIALIPWLKALFVSNGTVTLKDAPDNLPALSFILDYVNYCGAPCVPLGLLLIGSLLGRLEVSQVPKGFWKSVLSHTAYRLCILPIIGIAWATRMHKIGWFTDPMALFVCCMEFALPSATVQVYLTASHTNPDDDDCTPMNCLALYVIAQYCTVAISLPVVVCYTVKKVMDF